MARVAGIDIPDAKRAEVSLTYEFGIGRSTSRKILTEAGIDFDTKVRDIPEEKLVRIREIIDRTMKVEGDLRSEIQLAIKRLQDIKCYRGIRHRKRLPARGQRTRTNARTRKGRAKTVAGKKKAPSPK